jgi:crotonobetainyl-CoA:carnitine CoA-transferase CaiB-like acyl-CoA transferase
MTAASPRTDPAAVPADADDRPLEGVRVLDLTRILSGPYCTLLLADMGADVIKVERPGVGDDTRHWGPPFLADDASSYFAALNRGKRSLALDLKHEAARPVLRRLAREVDVVVENFRPGVAARLGLDHETLSRENPAIVSCSISGYGSTGAYSRLAGTEIVVEAMSGLMHVTGPIDGDPVRFGVAMVDIATGLTASSRIVASLLRAGRTGRGAHVEVSLYGTALAALGTLITSHTASGVEPTRWGSHHPSIAPYGGFPTADGHLITGAINDETWARFAPIVGLDPDDVATRWATNSARVDDRQALEAAISARTVSASTDEWVARLREADLLAAPIRTVGEAVADPATRDSGLLQELAGHPGVLSPRLDGTTRPLAKTAVPTIGADTADVLRELIGTDADELQALRSAGAVGP